MVELADVMVYLFGYLGSALIAYSGVLVAFVLLGLIFKGE